jgi:hypothetical protein
MNGFGNSASDMDLCLMLSHSEVSSHLKTAQFSMRHIGMTHYYNGSFLVLFNLCFQWDKTRYSCKFLTLVSLCNLKSVLFR